MTKITMNDFVDIASTAGTPKFTKVQQLKKRYEADYHPATDFYRPLRDHIRLLHHNGGTPEELDQVYAKISEKKFSHYHQVINGYKKWWKDREFEWFDPPSKYWTARKISININPELGLIIDGDPFLIKVYFKAEGLTKYKVNAMTALMNEHLAPLSPEGSIMSILEPRRSTLFHYDISNQKQLIQSLTGELAYISTVWD